MSTPCDDAATCLGCGCLCDDIGVSVTGGRLVRLANTCPLGERWFGDGVVPALCRIDENSASIDEALETAAALLFASPRRLLVYIAGDLTCETQREAVSLADRLGASIDGPASDTVADGLLAAQRRGRASATLGELRHRADAVLFWGVDPQVRYPRFLERFLLAPAALLPSRTCVAVDVGADRGPDICNERISLDAADEVDALSVMRAVVAGRRSGDLVPSLNATAELARRLANGPRYVAVIFDAEPGDVERDRAFVEGLIAFVQSLNSSTRAALIGLRAGGNRNGLESLLTWQTGYPFAVDFAEGVPVYHGLEPTAERLARGRHAAALVVGSPATVPHSVSARLKRVTTVAIGPRASEAAFSPSVAIDTGVAGIHEGGLVLRMDDVPLQARAVLSHPHSTAEVIRRLAARTPARSEIA